MSNFYYYALIKIIMKWKYKTTSNCAKLELLESISYIKQQYSLKTVEVNRKLLINRGAENRVAPVKPYEKLCISPTNTRGWHKRCLYSKRTTWKHVWSLSLTCPWDQLSLKREHRSLISTWQFKVEDNGKTGIFHKHSAHSLHVCTFCH